MRGMWVRLSGGLLIMMLAASLAAADCYVTILHFNDLHGYLQPVDREDSSVGGIARIGHLVDEVRAWNDPRGNTTLFLKAGDILQGTPMSAIYQGEPDVKCLNLMRLDVMCLGNHEFDFGRKNLESLRDLARFPMLAANIYFKGSDKRYGPAYWQFTLGDGTKGAAFGLTTPETGILTLPKNVEGLEFREPVAEARKVLAELGPEVKFLVAVTHLGNEEDQALARAVPDLDVIIGGHSHTVVEQPVVVGKTIITQAGNYGQYLGQLDLFVSGGEVIRHRGFLRRINEKVPEQKAVKQMVDLYAGQLGEQLKQVVAQAAVPLDGTRDLVRSQETNLGNLIADLMREYTRADVAIINGGGIRASIPAGPITVGDVLNVLPFSNLIATKEVSGEQLRRALEFAASLQRPSGGFLQVSGLSMVIEGNRLAEVKVHGQPLDPARTYTLAASEFVLSGGDGYAMLDEGADPVYLGFTDNTMVMELLKVKQTVSPVIEGRIVIR